MPKKITPKIKAVKKSIAKLKKPIKAKEVSKPSIREKKPAEVVVPKKLEKHYFYAVGRRKSATVVVKLYDGNGSIVVNGRDKKNYFPIESLRTNIIEPFELVGMNNKFDVVAKAHGGGVHAQSDALRLGIARALVVMDANLRSTLKKSGLLTRDPREKERKKP